MTAPACAHVDAPNAYAQAPGQDRAPTLMIQSELDAATPYEAGRRSAQLLKNTAPISVDNEGSRGLFPYGTTCVDDLVYDYFVNGTLPAATTACQAKPLPMDGGVTYEVAPTDPPGMRRGWRGAGLPGARYSGALEVVAHVEQRLAALPVQGVGEAVAEV